MELKSKKYISYIRVSTERQKNSGLGEEAQRATIAEYVARNGGEIVHEFVEVVSGTGKKNRPLVQKAMSMCRDGEHTLIVSKLDRLSREVKFIYSILDMKLDFVICNMPFANKLTLGIIAAIAQWEAETISERTTDALKALKARGVKLGNPKIGLYSAVAHAARDRSIDVNSPNHKAMGLILAQRNAGKSYQDIAKELNELNMRTTYGMSFTGANVSRIYKEMKPKTKSI